MITLYDIYRLNWQEVVHTTSKTLCKCQCFLGVTNSFGHAPHYVGEGYLCVACLIHPSISVHASI